MRKGVCEINVEQFARKQGKLGEVTIFGSAILYAKPPMLKMASVLLRYQTDDSERLDTNQ